MQASLPSVYRLSLSLNEQGQETALFGSQF